MSANDQKRTLATARVRQPCLAMRLGGVPGGNEIQGWRDSSHTAMVGAGKFGSAKLPIATTTYPGKPSPSQYTVEPHVGQKMKGQCVAAFRCTDPHRGLTGEGDLLSAKGHDVDPYSGKRLRTDLSFSVRHAALLCT